jgi:DNA repair photolyase
MSIPTVDDIAWTRLEPGTAPPLKRLRAVRELRDAGIDAAVLMMPLVPGITTSRSSIERTLSAIAEAGVAFAGAGVARFDPGAREHFFAFLERTYPDLVNGYGRLYQTTHAPAAYVQAVKSVVDETRGRLGRPGVDGRRRAAAAP